MVTGHAGYWSRELPGAAVVEDSETLEFGGRRFDAILHALSLHWAADPVGQLVQCRLALKPDAILIAALFGGGTLSELRHCLAAAETAITGGASPRVAPMGEIRALGGLLQRAGYTLPVADAVARAVEYESVRELMLDLRSMGETNALHDRSRRFAPRRLFEETERIYRTAYPGSRKAISATFECLFLTGWAPGAGQQQPLSPGSAQVSLAEALRGGGDQ